MKKLDRSSIVLLAAGLAAAAMAADAAPPPGAGRAISIDSSEIRAAVAEAPPTGLKDAVLRVLPVGNEYNVGVAAVRRVRVDGKTPHDAVEHHQVTEVYQIVQGGGTLVTGGELEQKSEMDKAELIAELGPTARGERIVNGVSRQVAVGDVIVIPAGVPHGFSEIAPEGVTYLLVRFDPHRVLKTR